MCIASRGELIPLLRYLQKSPPSPLPQFAGREIYPPLIINGGRATYLKNSQLRLALRADAVSNIIIRAANYAVILRGKIKRARGGGGPNVDNDRGRGGENDEKPQTRRRAYGVWRQVRTYT